MKTAVSIPDRVFEAAERLARRLGKSRSELYTSAICDYLKKHRDEDVTERLDEIYGAAPEASDLHSSLTDLQARSLGQKDWWVRRGNFDRPAFGRPARAITLDKAFLRGRIGRIPIARLREVDQGLRLVLVARGAARR